MAIQKLCYNGHCGRYNSATVDKCTGCGKPLKQNGLFKWKIRLRVDGKRRSFDVGKFPNKMAAQALHRKLETEITLAVGSRKLVRVEESTALAQISQITDRRGAGKLEGATGGPLLNEVTVTVTVAVADSDSSSVRV